MVLRTEAEVEAEIARGVVAGAAADLVHPNAILAMQGDARADRISVGAGADQMQTKPVVLVLGGVDEQHGQVAQVVHDLFHTAIVPQVGDGEAAARLGLLHSRAGLLRRVAESAIAEVAVEEAGLAEGRAEFGGIHLGVNVAVGDQQVGMAVVVHVGEHGPPAERVRIDAEAGFEGDVGEGAVAVVVVEGGGVVGEIGLEEVEVAIAVIVGSG